MTNIAKIYEIRIKKSATAARSFNVKRHLSRKVVQDNYDKDYYYMRVYLPVIMAFLKDVDVEYRSVSPFDGVSKWWLPIKARTPLEEVEKTLNDFYVSSTTIIKDKHLGDDKPSDDKDNKVVETDPDALHISTIGTVPDEDENPKFDEDYEEDAAEEDTDGDDDFTAKEAENTLKEQYQLPPAVNETPQQRPAQQVFVPQREYKNNNNQNRQHNGGHNNKPGSKNK